MMTFQIADVTKPLVSEGRITAKRHRRVLDCVDAYVEQKATGMRVKVHKQGNVLIMRAKVMPDAHMQQSVGAMDVDVMHEPSFMRQED